MVLDGKFSQEYPVNAGFPQCPTRGPTLFLPYSNELADDICNVAIYADDTTLYSTIIEVCQGIQQLLWLLPRQHRVFLYLLWH